MSLSYKKSGVDYSLLDPIKRMAQLAGLKTTLNTSDTDIKEVTASRGETAYILEGGDCYYALVEEGLGTKNLVADALRRTGRRTYYDAIAYDTVAAIVNDLSSVGARPLTVLAYWAVGDSRFWKDEKRAKDLVDGWKSACDDAGATWGGGETPSMNDIVTKTSINLAGAAFGIIKPKSHFISGDKISPGDKIIIFESSGIHANGLSLARKIAVNLSNGYQTKLKSNKTFGEELLVPSRIYSRLVNELLERKVDVHYFINITGHGWRKLLRASKKVTYFVENIIPVPVIFSFLQKHSGLTDSEMYGTFNMGAGFAAIVPPKDVKRTLSISQKNGIKAYLCGFVAEGDKKVIIEPINVTYHYQDLNLR